MSDVVLVPVEVPFVGEERHKNWARLIDSVDADKSSGWAYKGPFVEVGGVQDLPAGGLLLVYGERGSRANPQTRAVVYRVNSDATLSPEAEARGRAWARTLRDPVERLLGTEPRGPDLSGVADELLADELRARGWRVDRV
ncbi:MAG: hypothetical protein L0Z49_10415 [Actinobacteria bacterium]|nr:hypothetical protein [Actinomycetota bacterium]